MEIIKRGTVERGILGSWWLVDDNFTSTTRLSGEWVEQYRGRKLVIALDEEGEPFFEIAAKILNGVEEK